MTKKLDVAVIGAGPAGLAAAIKLKESGIANVMMFERNSFLGGILPQCIHTGFGITYYRDELTGPEYAVRMIDSFLAHNIPYQLNANVIDLNSEKVLTVSSSQKGIEEYNCRSVIIATGCRERTRENLEIPGSRPAGIFTAGQAQTLVNIKNYKIGHNVIIQGSGDIGLIMARRLKIEGYNVIKVFERLPYLSGLIRNKVQCLDDFGIPVEFSSQISLIHGNSRVNGVSVQRLDEKQMPVSGSTEFYECDTVLFSVGLIPEIELAKRAGIVSSNRLNPDINSVYETNIDGIFICGNALHVHDLADNASIEGEKTAEFTASYLENETEFINIRTAAIPYKETEKNHEYNKSFFENIRNSGKLICTVCPRSCILSCDDYSCRRGEEFFRLHKKERRMTLATTIRKSGTHSLVPVRSEEQVVVSDISEIMDKLKKGCSNDSRIRIVHNGKTIIFNPASRHIDL